MLAFGMMDNELAGENSLNKVNEEGLADELMDDELVGENPWSLLDKKLVGVNL